MTAIPPAPGLRIRPLTISNVANKADARLVMRPYRLSRTPPVKTEFTFGIPVGIKGDKVIPATALAQAPLPAWCCPGYRYRQRRSDT